MAVRILQWYLAFLPILIKTKAFPIIGSDTNVHLILLIVSLCILSSYDGNVGELVVQAWSEEMSIPNVSAFSDFANNIMIRLGAEKDDVVREIP